MRGTVSEQEVDYISNLVPTTYDFRKSIIGVAAGEKEIEYLRKRLPKGIK